MLPIRNNLSGGKVIRRKRYVDGNAVGRTNDNPILDTKEYRIDFYDGEVIELAVNVIAKYIYAACDDSVNEYVMMDSIVD